MFVPRPPNTPLSPSEVSTMKSKVQEYLVEKWNGGKNQQWLIRPQRSLDEILSVVNEEITNANAVFKVSGGQKSRWKKQYQCCILPDGSSAEKKLCRIDQYKASVDRLSIIAHQ